MRQSLIAAAAIFAVVLPASAHAQQAGPALKAAVAAPTRSATSTPRDQYRHPAETLAFFGIKPGDTIVEIWPGGGWYTEILAPYTKGKGTLYAAAPWPNGVNNVKTKQTADAATYGAIKLAAFPHTAPDHPKVPDGSADAVLTFRNVHNWRMGEKDFSADAFAQMFAMLKPGGILGIEDHRLPESAPDERQKTSGYMKVSTVRALAEAAGFEFVAASEINANPKDTADWKDGVWTLPPVLRNKEVDREKYLAIGESDRMTLKFRKPKK